MLKDTELEQEDGANTKNFYQESQHFYFLSEQFWDTRDSRTLRPIRILLLLYHRWGHCKSGHMGKEAGECGWNP